MVSMGALDLEGSFGILTAGFGPEDIYNATISAYYTVNDSIELSAGYYVYFDSDDSEDFFHVGGSYMLQNSDLAINAKYRDARGESIIDLGVSWSFGGNRDMRLFSERGVDIFFFGPT